MSVAVATMPAVRLSYRVASGVDPAGLPALGAGPAPRNGERVVRFRAMASDITLQVCEPAPHADLALVRARQIMEMVASSCTRFDPLSALMRANAAGEEWVDVPTECFEALAEAAAAHAETGGLFDPRVLRVLTALGYDRSFALMPDVAPSPRVASRPAGCPVPPRPPAAPTTPWRPGLDAATSRVRIGPDPVDLGGIGKGLAVRWAAQHLAGSGRAFLVEAGGDCYVGGAGPEGEGWRVAVEDPRGGDEPLAVLNITDGACATSSVRVRRWRSGDRQVHHLVDPRQAASAEGGLLSVTVVLDDPARAEVWSKVLFICGSGEIRSAAEQRGLAALWVEESGEVQMSRAMAGTVVWEAPRAR